MSKASSRNRWRVVALVDEGSNPFELSCLIEVLAIDRPECGGALYELTVCADQRSVRMRQGLFTMSGIAGLEAMDALQQGDTLIVPNRPDTSAPHPRRVLRAISSAYERGVRVVGMCSGAFTLAEAGVLEGHRVTLHWLWADEFRRRYPHVTVEEDVLFIDDGQILTSAGSTAALDLGLHLVRKDHGAEIGTMVARRLVFPGHRPGGQRQYIERPMPPQPADGLGEVLAWAEEHATEPFSVADLARRACVSTATLHRRFRAELGCTPNEWLTGIRVDRARVLLEATSLSVKQVARMSGLGTDVNLRRHLTRRTGLPPTAYRRNHPANTPLHPE